MKDEKKSFDPHMIWDDHQNPWDANFTWFVQCKRLHNYGKIHHFIAG